MKALYILFQCIWGAPQTFLGAVLFLFNLRRKHFFHHGAVVTEWQLRSSVSLGLFVFVSDGNNKALLAHEHGHTIQSLILGWLYLPFIGLPSIVWAGMFGKIRRTKSIPYYSFYTERWADRLESRFVK